VVEPADHVEVLEAGEVLIDRGVLAGEPDVAAHVVRVFEDVDARDFGGAAVGAQEGGEDAHGRRLAGAIGAEQPEHGAGADIEVDTAERGDLAVALGQAGRPDGVLPVDSIGSACAGRAAEAGAGGIGHVRDRTGVL